jgi:hypothetical protein
VWLLLERGGPAPGASFRAGAASAQRAVLRALQHHGGERARLEVRALGLPTPAPGERTAGRPRPGAGGRPPRRGCAGNSGRKVRPSAPQSMRAAMAARSSTMPLSVESLFAVVSQSPSSIFQRRASSSARPRSMSIGSSESALVPTRSFFGARPPERLSSLRFNSSMSPAVCFNGPPRSRSGARPLAPRAFAAPGRAEARDPPRALARLGQGPTQYLVWKRQPRRCYSFEDRRRENGHQSQQRCDPLTLSLKDSARRIVTHDENFEDCGNRGCG